MNSDQPARYYCPKCGAEIPDSEAGIWTNQGNEYCSENCCRQSQGMQPVTRVPAKPTEDVDLPGDAGDLLGMIHDSYNWIGCVRPKDVWNNRLDAVIRGTAG